MVDFTASHVVFAATACPRLTMVLGRYAPRDATLAVTEEKMHGRTARHLHLQ